MSKKPKKKRPVFFRGLPMVDASEDLNLSITPADIRRAIKNRKDPNNCAAAEAIKRQEICKDVAVYMSRTYVKDKDRWVRYVTPSAISREVTSFDRGSEFEPGDYTLKAPSPSNRLGVHRGKTTRKTGKQKKQKHVTLNVRSWHE